MRIQLSNGEYLTIDVRKKHVKNMTLRVYPDGAIKATAPVGVSDVSIRRFIEEKKNWLAKHVQRTQEDKPDGREEDVVRLLGNAYPYHVVREKRNDVVVREEDIIICCREGSKPMAVLDWWWRKTALEYYQLYVEKWTTKLAGIIPRRPRIVHESRRQ